jgi:hypothetical protein
VLSTKSNVAKYEMLQSKRIMYLGQTTILHIHKLPNWDAFVGIDASGLIRAWLWEEQNDPNSYGGVIFTHESPKENGSCFRLLAACPTS